MNRKRDSGQSMAVGRRVHAAVAFAIATLAPLLSLLWLAFLVWCYSLRGPDHVLVTMLPIWLWAAPALVPALLPLRLCKFGRAWLLVAAWLVVIACFSEEPLAQVRAWSGLPAARSLISATDHPALRVVSANCGGGEVGALRDALAQEPDVLLLQESPSVDDIRRELDALSGWSLHCGTDCIVAVRGTLEPLALGGPYARRDAAVDAEVDEHKLRVVSLHLTLPTLRGDVWNPQAWRLARDAYGSREAELFAIRDVVRSAPPDRDVIVGGDFNTPARDSLFTVFQPNLHDAWREAGGGPANTWLDRMPVARVDQVWLGPRLHAFRVSSHYTAYSDHRIVVCDVAPTEG